MTEVKLHLGCGQKILEGFINIDTYHGADLVLDLEDAKLPYEDNQALEIRSLDFLEHIRNFIPLMNECWRVLDQNGIFYAEVPRVPSMAAFSDPTHVRFFTHDTFHYFTRYGHIQVLYGIKPWEEIRQELTEDRIFITMKPKK